MRLSYAEDHQVPHRTLCFQLLFASRNLAWRDPVY